MDETRARPTLITVANLAGVSVASASRVLNGQPASRAMTERVRRAADEVGYVADAVARSLKAGRTRQLAFAVADVGNPVYVAMMRAIEEFTKLSGYRLLVHSTGSDPNDEIGLIESLRNGYVDGLIISPLRITDDHLRAFESATAPIVVVGTLPPQVPLDNVRAESELGVRLAIRHLVKLGRRRIALVNGPTDLAPGKYRRSGYEAGLRDAGLDLVENLVETAADFSNRPGYEAARLLLRRTVPDAIMCANDLIAMGALRALSESGLRVPDDVAVVGMDDTDLAQLSLPSLSSVSLGSIERGRIAGNLLLERIDDPDLKPRRITVPPSLIVRESSGPRSGTGEERV
jgi:LacI family transcriptional regulator